LEFRRVLFRSIGISRRLSLVPNRPLFLPLSVLVGPDETTGVDGCRLWRFKQVFHVERRSWTASNRCWSAQGFHMEQFAVRSEEHTSELQSRFDLVCRLLLEKKKLITRSIQIYVL